MSIAIERIELSTNDGWRLQADLHACPGPWAVALVGHAMMVDRRTMDRPAGSGLCSALAAAGVVALNVDFRGHGQSAGPRSFDFESIAHGDVPTALTWLADRWPGLPRFVVGHSLGANATLLHLARAAAGVGAVAGAEDGGEAPGPLAGLVAFAPNLWLPKHEPGAVQRALKRVALAAWEMGARGSGHFDPSLVGLGSSPIPRAYAQQLRGWWERDGLRGTDGFDYEAALAEVHLPVLAYASEGDRLMARPQAVQAFMSMLQRGPVDLRVVRGAGAPDHMGWVTDPAMRVHWDHAIGWMRTRAALT